MDRTVDRASPAATTAPRRALLTAALGFAQLQWHGETPAPARALHAYMDTWRGLGAVVNGMHAQGFDLKLEQYPTGWWAHFYASAHAHAVCVGTAWERDPWRAVQLAAQAALKAPRVLA